MGRLLLLLALLAATPLGLGAQTERNLERAIELYQNLEVERARDLFLQVISPNSPFEVTPEQRVTAYLYLGATLASLNRPDSAVDYFVGAIERDPFADLDPEIFTEAERNVFAQARRRAFKVGIRPLDAARLDPRRDRLTIETMTTHDGTLRVEVSNTQRALRFPIFEGPNDGLRELEWSGILPGGELVPQGRYALIVTGVSLLNRRVDSASVLFTLQHEFEALEDTLRELRSDELLPERAPVSVARRDFLMGLGVAAGALIIPPALGVTELGTPYAYAAAVGGLAIGTGVFAYVRRTQHPEIPANVLENQRRELRRRQYNDTVTERNRAKLAETILIVTPTTGVRR